MKLLILFLLLTSCSPKFYDGEGNRIPKRVVHLLVRSEFIVTDKWEDSVLNKYFYCRRFRKVTYEPK